MVKYRVDITDEALADMESLHYMNILSSNYLHLRMQWDNIIE